MTRRVFYSFHYAPDNWRASQVRNIGAIEGNEPAKDNDWETITKGGDKEIEKWISDQMDGRSCVVVVRFHAKLTQDFHLDLTRPGVRLEGSRCG